MRGSTGHSKGLFRFIIIVLLLASLVLASVFADRGSISIIPYVRVLEPGQKAIVAWNGQEEILILSTDVKANQSTLILELLPLPSNPKTIERADFDSFIRLQQIVWGPIRSHADSENLFIVVEQADLERSVVVTFHEEIGAHNITVVRAENAVELAEWINDFLSRNSVTNDLSIDEYASVFEDYMSRGFHYFALDLVEVATEKRSVEPILYHFETDFLYYPLKISTLFSGNTKIKLFILTHEVCDFLYYSRMVKTPWASSFVYVEEGNTKMYSPANYTWSLGRVYQYNLTVDKLKEIDLRLESLFNSSAHLTVLEYSGALDTFTGDMIMREGEAFIVYPFVPSVPLVLSMLDPLAFQNLGIIPSNWITIQTLEEIEVTTSPHESLVLVDYLSPAISEVDYRVSIDGSILIRCQAEDTLSGVDKVELHYQIQDEEWEKEVMEETDEWFTSAVPMEPYKNLNFYIEAFDLVGNRAVRDNNATYLIESNLYMSTLIINSIALVAACILLAAFTALIVMILMKKRSKP